VYIGSNQNQRRSLYLVGKAVTVKRPTGRLRFAIIGALLGGIIAVIAYWILRPSVDSMTFYVALRVLVGAIVAMLVGPIIVSSHTKTKPD
jgi:hypothetical protein